MILAVTGGTGFLGGHVLRIAAERGHDVRALARRAQLPRPNVEWLGGTLEDHRKLAELCKGADAVIHIAGAINAPNLAGFVAANVTGTASLLTAAEASGTKRFIHVSSLSAREPDLSDYGWSKASSEAMVVQSPLDWTIVRPPAIYGAGDREMLELFRIARAKGVLPLPPRGRLSLIEAGDLAGLLLDLIEARESFEQTYEPDDGTEEGYSHRAFGKLVGAAVGRPGVLALPVPGFALRLAATAERFRLGDKAKLTPDRVRYFCHPDWVVTKRPPTAIWEAKVKAGEGLKATADWYREQGWL
ncbi:MULTISPECIES: SDR family oxidoreductase [unclassified Sphingomonas]|uniref:SDR family oxidoreductase n=1 Tax=unclassified Sphingomonas TaxID=196159 RepID=UPI0006F3A324|nr:MULTISPECIES: NAD(P)-dependent oxidoreductase [unclassified Sphingomonas]KQX17788.1 epimerase [Sphingomonas sp. Root1294]KQY70714.1 epimerase [Sphingomonas sp. Root50]KRB91793.1 epimerase [Sphingomonas sp. Root720]